MALGIDFEKTRLEQLVGCLNTGSPFPPTSSVGWSRNDMLLLAGVCFFGAWSHGPVTYPGVELSELSPEREEAVWAQLNNDIHSAIDFYGRVSRMLFDGEYDDHFAPHVRAAIEFTDDKAQIKPLEGFKDDAVGS